VRVETSRDVGARFENRPETELLVRFGAEILEKSFPPTEYVPNCFVGSGPLTDPFLVACAPDGTILGGACGEVYPHSNSLLLGYLAVRQGLRGTGVGGLLMRELRERWVRPGQLALLEIDDPRHHAVRDDYGDPTARARFYDRFGVRGLAVPYFQPRLGPALPRGYHMILSAMALPEGGDAVAGSAVRAAAAPGAALAREAAMPSYGSLI